MNKVDTYVGNDLGDFVRCNNCDVVMLVPCGTDICPNCDTEGRLSWVDENRQEQRLSDLQSAGYTVGRIVTPKLDTPKLHICPDCQEEALRYAMIDVDGTNLEEGYACGECGDCFIGLDNEQVIKFNPEITKENE